MGRLTRNLGAVALAGSLGACSLITDQEAGSVLDEGNFGAPTMNNHLVQTGAASAQEALAGRFSSEVVSVVNFAFNSDRLDPTAQAVLRKQAEWIRQFPEVKFRVYGHTDLVGPNAYNKQLGLRRAQAVVSYLSTLGISRSRLEALASFGETQPLIVTQGRERRNRRTVTEVSGFVHGHGNGLNGKYAAVIFREYVASARPAPGVTPVQSDSGAN